MDRRTAAAKVRVDVAQEPRRCPCSLFSLDLLPFGTSPPPPRLESATSLQPEHFILIFPICCWISLFTTFVPVPPSISCTLPHNCTHSDSSLFGFLPSLSLFTARSSFPSFALTIVPAGRSFGRVSRGKSSSTLLRSPASLHQHHPGGKDHSSHRSISSFIALGLIFAAQSQASASISCLPRSYSSVSYSLINTN